MARGLTEFLLDHIRHSWREVVEPPSRPEGYGVGKEDPQMDIGEIDTQEAPRNFQNPYEC